MALRATDRVKPRPGTNNFDGEIRLNWQKTLWLLLHALGGLAALLLYPSWGGLAAFLVLSAITLCAGHSVGMHRHLIHRSFEAPRWLSRTLIWLGTLVGMAGPYGMIRAHDMRDWHQRQTTCPPHPSHEGSFWKDAYWQLCCEYQLKTPPEFVIEDQWANDPILNWVERHWMAQQLILALPLSVFGGVSWVLWGVCLRVFVSLTGHWLVGHYAHRKGALGPSAPAMSVTGYNLPGLGLIAFGENWHANHHAYPQSAKLGIGPRQVDPGYSFVLLLEKLGLMRDVNHGPQL